MDDGEMDESDDTELDKIIDRAVAENQPQTQIVQNQNDSELKGLEEQIKKFWFPMYGFESLKFITL